MNDLFEFFKREPKLWPSEGIVCIFKILIDDLIDLCETIIKWRKDKSKTINRGDSGIRLERWRWESETKFLMLLNEDETLIQQVLKEPPPPQKKKRKKENIIANYVLVGFHFVNT